MPNPDGTRIVLPVLAGTNALRTGPEGGDLALDSDDSRRIKLNQAGTVRTLVTDTDTQTLTNKTLTAPVLGAATGTSLAVTGRISSSGAAAAGGIGYATGAGGTATQITSRTTGVTMSPNPCMSGLITTDTSSLGAELAADFVVTNSAVAIGDVVVVSVRSGSNGGATIVSVTTVTGGTFTIRVYNGNAAAGTAETGAILINFAVIKAVSA